MGIAKFRYSFRLLNLGILKPISDITTEIMIKNRIIWEIKNPDITLNIPCPEIAK